MKHQMKVCSPSGPIYWSHVIQECQKSEYNPSGKFALWRQQDWTAVFIKSSLNQLKRLNIIY